MTSTKLASRLEAALGHLAHHGDHPLIIQLVEHWHSVGDPTPLARLAAVRSLMALCQMDRAWSRLRELLEQHPKWVLAHLTAAELFLTRGWPKQAAKSIEIGLALHSNHPQLCLLQDRLRVAEDANEHKIDVSNPLQRLVEAKSLLATGSSVKGRAILYQLKKDNFEPPELTQLLWACGADFALKDLSLWSHYADQDQRFETLADLGEAPFPTESTHTTPPGRLDPKELIACEDTGILRLVSEDETARVRPSDGRIHTNTPAELGEFDLEAYRREWGMVSPSPLASMEDEDADLIVFRDPPLADKRQSDDTTSEWLIPDATTAEPTEELLYSPSKMPGAASTQSKSPTHRARPAIAWLVTIAILIAVGLLVGTLAIL
jgi:hypothetical protein